MFLRTLQTNFVRHFLYDDTAENVNRWNFIVTAWVLTAFLRFRTIPSLIGRRRPGLLFLLICAVHVSAFSYSDDLPRYFVPMLPFFYLPRAGALAVVLAPKVPDWVIVACTGLLGAAFTTNYHGRRSAPGFQLESNLDYVDSVGTHLDAARYLEREQPGSLIATCWPMNGELTEPRHGYVSSSLPVTLDIENAPPAALLYYSPESACRGSPAIRRRVSRARLLRRFERNGRRAEVYLLDGE